VSGSVDAAVPEAHPQEDELFFVGKWRTSQRELVLLVFVFAHDVGLTCVVG
jgi:hypothetical protein